MKVIVYGRYKSGLVWYGAVKNGNPMKHHYQA